MWNFHFLLAKLGAGGVQHIYPTSHIVVEMMDGSVFAGEIAQHAEDHEIPAWINPPHHELGRYNVYIRTPYGIYWTAHLRERRLPQIPNKPHVPFHLYVQTRTNLINVQWSAKNLRIIDDRHRLDPSKEVAYLSMPEGNVYIADL